MSRKNRRKGNVLIFVRTAERGNEPLGTQPTMHLVVVLNGVAIFEHNKALPNDEVLYDMLSNLILIPRDRIEILYFDKDDARRASSCLHEYLKVRGFKNITLKGYYAGDNS